MNFKTPKEVIQINVVVETGRQVASLEFRIQQAALQSVAPGAKTKNRKLIFWIEVLGALRVSDNYTKHNGNTRYGKTYILTNDVGFYSNRSSTKNNDSTSFLPTTAPREF
jgi:hypothetical protein